MNIRLKTRKFKEFSQLSKVHHRNSNEMIFLIDWFRIIFI